MLTYWFLFAPSTWDRSINWLVQRLFVNQCRLCKIINSLFSDSDFRFRIIKIKVSLIANAIEIYWCCRSYSFLRNNIRIYFFTDNFFTTTKEPSIRMVLKSSTNRNHPNSQTKTCSNICPTSESTFLNLLVRQVDMDL